MQLRSLSARISIVALLLASLLVTARAHANGRFPASSALTFDPSDPNRVYLRSTFGLIVSTDAGKTWDWVCERSLGFSGPEDPMIGVFADGTVAASLFEGLAVSSDRACGFTLAEGDLKKKVFVDLSVRATSPKDGVAISSGYGNKTDKDGNPQFLSEVFFTSDSGKTWAKKGASLDPSLLLETVDFSPQNEKRIFISAVRGSGKNVKGVLLVSNDAGVTFSERAIPLDAPQERAPYIAALDPNDVNTLYIRTAGAVDAGARLLVSKDLGASFKSVLALKGPMKGFALSGDGKKVYAGGPKDGVHEASTADYAFTKKSDVQAQCLASRGSELWACSNESNGFVAGTSTDDGATFKALFHLKDLRGPLACDQTSRTAQLCKADWPKQRLDLGIVDAANDAGAPSKSAPPDAASTSKSGCGCTTLGSTKNAENGFFSSVFAIGAVAAFAFRKRRRESRILTAASSRRRCRLRRRRQPD